MTSFETMPPTRHSTAGVNLNAPKPLFTSSTIEGSPAIDTHLGIKPATVGFAASLAPKDVAPIVKHAVLLANLPPAV